MPKKTPESLKGQAKTLAEAAAAAADWFRDPQPTALSAARTARLRARSWRVEAVAALKAGRGPAKRDAADMSYSLREAVEGVVEAVSDAAQWGVGADESLARMADSLLEGSRALSRAAAAAGGERAEALIGAKRWAADVERRRRAARAEDHDSTRFVDAVKRGEIATLLSSAAEGLAQACDALAGSLAE